MAEAWGLKSIAQTVILFPHHSRGWNWGDAIRFTFLPILYDVSK